MKNILRKIKTTLIGLVISQALVEIYWLFKIKKVEFSFSRHNFGINISLKKEGL
jgi:hypothetical protein